MLFNNLNSITKTPCSVFKLLINSIVFFFVTLSGSVLFAAQVEIKFDPSLDPRATGYYFYYGEDTNLRNKVNLGNNTSHVVSNLNEGATYYFAATAYDIYGNESRFSEILSYQVPSEFNDSENNQEESNFIAQVEIKFDPSLDLRAAGHYFYYGQTTNFSNKVDLGTNNSYVVSNLQEGATYYFAATAYDIYGNESRFSEILSYQVPGNDQCSEENYECENYAGNQEFGGDNLESSLYSIEDFENYMTGSDPPNWFDTKANNSMDEDNSLFRIFTIDNNNVFGTTSTLSNIHSHHIRSYIENLSSFEYSGRLMMTDPDGGIGVTFLSHYPFTDAYYRLRCTRNHSSFHISPHPYATAIVFGANDSGVIPIPNEWYRFRILVQDTGIQTEILAKIWPENTSEPLHWQIDAFDDTSNRLVSGTFGLWSGHAGDKYWDDLMVK